MDAALSYAEQHLDRFVGELEDLLRIPSVSTDSAYAEHVQEAADWLAARFERAGLDRAEVVETDGHPIVYAEHHAGDDRPTVLVYGHYDVQPPDPLAEWDTDPFEPTRRNGTLYARGACDDKGQMYMHVSAAEALLETGSPPVNLKFIIEGEEEVGSEHLAPFLEARREDLAADVVLISDTSMFSPEVPTITYGLRGLAYAEVTLKGPNRDLHSGVYGGAVENPANALSALIAGLHDEDHRVAIPGFYEHVRDLTPAERETYAELPFDEEAWAEEIGLDATKTEAGYSVLECLSARPTLDVNGIWGGYTGEGAKTVLPATAHAKISMRLVPEQTPEEAYDKLEAHLEAEVPETMTLTVRRLHGGRPVLVDRTSDAMQAATQAMGEVMGPEPRLVRHGGSIPIVADFKDILGLDSVLLGFGLTSDAIHSPNEHFGLDRFAQGFRSIIRFHHHYAASQ